MRKLALGVAAALALGFGVTFVHAADDMKKVSGILIDNKCAAKFANKEDPEKAAAAHPAACALTCAADGKFVLIHGKKQLTLDKHGQELAKAYLSKDGASTKVTITGEQKDDELKVESIEKQEAKG